MPVVLTVMFFILLMPITGLGWVEGSNVILDPVRVCKRNRQQQQQQQQTSLASSVTSSSIASASGHNDNLHDICRNNTRLLDVIMKGINLSLDECQFQFRHSRWNCTTQRRSMKKILAKDTRETGFVNAISAAGIAYAVTKACSSGNLVECTCHSNYTQFTGGTDEDVAAASRNLVDGDEEQREHNQIQDSGGGRREKHRRQHQHEGEQQGKKQRTGKNNFIKNLFNSRNLRRQLKKANAVKASGGDWKWGGCSDNVQFGLNKSKTFLDARIRSRRDIKTLVKTHNNIAGLLAIRRYMQLRCRCHGMSGSCTMQTCWLVMPSFREIGERLKDRYDGAAKVIASNDGVNFIPEGETIKTPTREDLVYTDTSPDFCHANHRTGSLGTQGRQCNSSSMATDGCDLMCCNRGYVADIEVRTVSCNCKFEWCCEVKCQKCNERRQRFTCS